MELIWFGGLSLSCVDEDVAFPFDTLQSVVALRGGVFDELGTQVVPRAFSLARTFKIVDAHGQPAKVGQELDALMGVFVAGERVLRARWKDGTERQTFAKVVQATRPTRDADKTYQEISATWFIPFPYWFLREHEPLYLDHGYYLDDGHLLDGNYSAVVINSTSETLTIINNGNAPIQRGQLVIRPAPGADIDTITVTNVTNSQSWTFAATIEYPEALSVDLLSKSVKLDAVNAYNDVALPSGQIEWLTLEVGENEIEITCDSVTGSVEFEWHWADTFV